MGGKRKLRKARRGEINYPMFDQWAYVHAGFGAVFGAAGVSLTTALVLTIGYELIEDSLKRGAPKAFPVGTADTTANHIGDTVSFMTGWAMGRKMR